MALSSFVRRVSGSILPLPIRSSAGVGSQFIQYLRCSTTSIDTEVLRVLESDNSISTNPPQMVCTFKVGTAGYRNSLYSIEVEGMGEVPFKVVEEDSLFRDKIVAIRTLDGKDIFETRVHCEDDILDPKVGIYGYRYKGNIRAEFSFQVHRDSVILNRMTLGDYVDWDLKGFEKVFDITGFNPRSMTKFLLEEFEK